MCSECSPAAGRARADTGGENGAAARDRPARVDPRVRCITSLTKYCEVEWCVGGCTVGQMDADEDSSRIPGPGGNTDRVRTQDGSLFCRPDCRQVCATCHVLVEVDLITALRQPQ